MVTTSDRVSALNTLPPPPPRNGDLVLNGRPRAHQEDPIRALHSPMLQSGIRFRRKSGMLEIHIIIQVLILLLLSIRMTPYHIYTVSDEITFMCSFMLHKPLKRITLLSGEWEDSNTMNYARN